MSDVLLPTDRETTETTDDSTLGKVLFSSLLPLVHLAIGRMRSLKDLKRLVEMAYYREARQHGLTQRDISDRLSISMGKVGLLSRQVKEYFSHAETSRSLERRILALLGAGPQSETRIAQFLDDADSEDVAEAIRVLVRKGMIESVTGNRKVVRYRLSATQFRQGHDDWSAKLDGLNRFMRSVAGLIEARFFRQDENAAVRNLSFRVRPEDMPQLTELYEKQLFPLACDLDEKAADSDTSIPINLGLYWVAGLDDD